MGSKFPEPMFDIHDDVTIAVSGEKGMVMAVTYDEFRVQYLIRYKAADGRAVEAWWEQNALVEKEYTSWN